MTTISLSPEQAIAILRTAERGGGVYTHLEQALEGLGWRYVCDGWYSPEAVATLPVCAYCHERCLPEGGACYADAAQENQWRHAPQAVAT
jgi:hypothetical protein